MHLHIPFFIDETLLSERNDSQSYGYLTFIWHNLNFVSIEKGVDTKL